MRITKLGHACVRIEHDRAVVVLDPGVFTDAGATEGATAVLVTHEHADHWSAEHLRATDAPIWTTHAVADVLAAEAPDLGERVRRITPGETFDAGVPVTAVGELHAVIHEEIPRIHNSGYVLDVDGTLVYHPGDALTLPERDVDLLCVPVSAPWMKASEAIDFARAVGAPRNLAIHDRVYSEAGLGIVDGHMARFLDPAGQSYSRLADGTDLEL